jgi:hypothetical protein
MFLDYKPLRGRIATRVGKVLGKSPNNHKRGDPRFCVIMDPKWEWVSSINMLGVKGKMAKTYVDFE